MKAPVQLLENQTEVEWAEAVESSDSSKFGAVGYKRSGSLGVSGLDKSWSVIPSSKLGLVISSSSSSKYSSPAWNRKKMKSFEIRTKIAMKTIFSITFS